MIHADCLPVSELLAQRGAFSYARPACAKTAAAVEEAESIDDLQLITLDADL